MKYAELATGRARAGASWSDKFLVIPGLILGNALALSLLLLHRFRWASSTRSAIWITQNGTAVGIIVQLISQLMGLAVMQTLCRFS